MKNKPGRRRPQHPQTQKRNHATAHMLDAILTAEEPLPDADATSSSVILPPSSFDPGDSDLVFFSERKSRDIDWLWENRIPLGKCSLLVGDPDSGKSFLVLDLAARVSRGLGVPPERGMKMSGSVLLLSADDDADDTILPRLEAAEADLSKVAMLPSFVSGTKPGSQRLLSLSSDIDRLERALERLPDCRLIVVDPISAYLRGVDGNNNVTVRQLLLKLAGVARRQGAAMVLVSHQRKAAAATTMYRAIGSLAFTAVARVVLLVTADPAVQGRRLLLPVKMTLGNCTSGRAFSIESGRVVWEKELVPLTADEMVAVNRMGEISRDSFREAKVWLQMLLVERGRVPAEEIHRLALERRIPRGLLFAAKKKANVRAVFDGKQNRWYWELFNPSLALTLVDELSG